MSGKHQLWIAHGVRAVSKIRSGSELHGFDNLSVVEFKTYEQLEAFRMGIVSVEGFSENHILTEQEKELVMDVPSASRYIPEYRACYAIVNSDVYDRDRVMELADRHFESPDEVRAAFRKIYHKDDINLFAADDLVSLWNSDAVLSPENSWIVKLFIKKI